MPSNLQKREKNDFKIFYQFYSEYEIKLTE